MERVRFIQYEYAAHFALTGTAALVTLVIVVSVCLTSHELYWYENAWDASVMRGAVAVVDGGGKSVTEKIFEIGA